MSFERPTEQQEFTPENVIVLEKERLEGLNDRVKEAGRFAIAAFVLLTTIGCERAPSEKETAPARSEQSEAEYSGYGIKTKTKGGRVVETPYGQETEGKKEFSGYGIKTEKNK